MKLWCRHQSRESIAYHDTGTGQAVVLVHAFPLDQEMFAELHADHTGYRLLTPDVFGFGGSRLSTEWSIEHYADTLADWLEDVCPGEQVLFGGVSLGGYVALAMARRHPHRLKGLLLIDTRAEADSEEARLSRGKSIELVRTSGTAALVEAMLPKVLGATTWEKRADVVERTRRLMFKQKPEAVIAALAALRDRPDSQAVLPTISVPTLVVVGAEDTLTPPSVAQSMVAAIPGAELAIISEAGHLPNLETPEAFQELLQGFPHKLKSDPARTA